jgi:hypothetical protein
MSETSSPSADERAELERLRSEVATLRSQVQAGGAKPTRPGAAVGGRQRWRTIVANLCVHLGLAAAAPLDWPKARPGWPASDMSTPNYLAPLALGGRVESANGPCPLTDGGIEDLA